MSGFSLEGKARIRLNLPLIFWCDAVTHDSVYCPKPCHLSSVLHVHAAIGVLPLTLASHHHGTDSEDADVHRLITLRSGAWQAPLQL